MGRQCVRETLVHAESSVQRSVARLLVESLRRIFVLKEDLVGTFAGIFMAYGMVGPVASKIKIVRQKQMRPYIVVKQTLLAFMNGAMPQIALEHGRKTISAYERPSIDEVEEATVTSGQTA